MFKKIGYIKRFLEVLGTHWNSKAFEFESYGGMREMTRALYNIY